MTLCTAKSTNYAAPVFAKCAAATTCSRHTEHRLRCQAELLQLVSPGWAEVAEIMG